jgi:hypothetical protein
MDSVFFGEKPRLFFTFVSVSRYEKLCGPADRTCPKPARVLEQARTSKYFYGEDNGEFSYSQKPYGSQTC